MSKDKGSKNRKKKKADKFSGKKKISAYKLESEGGHSVIEPVVSATGPNKKDDGGVKKP